MVEELLGGTGTEVWGFGRRLLLCVKVWIACWSLLPAQRGCPPDNV